MAEPKGPYLPRKTIALGNHRKVLEAAASQAGVMVAIERNRSGWTQHELADEIGVDQVQVSCVENGRKSGLTNRQIDKLFELIDLERDTMHANFVKWWRDNGSQ